MNATFSAIAGAIATAAPTLAAMLGGPLAGTAVTALESVLGVKTGAGADAVAAALKNATMTPEQLVAMRTADDDLKVKLGQQGIDLAKINADYQTHLVDADNSDRSSARLRETNVRDWTPKIIAGVTLTACFALEAAVLFGYVPDRVDKVILGRILGTLDSATAMILAYYYGSSSGAARGQELLAQSTPTGGPIGVTSK